jgi:tripartite-type tricarboxylate transporter receptor subunit TctC
MGGTLLMNGRTALGLAFGLAASIAASPAGAAGADAFYRDRTVTFLIGYSVNNGYDVYSRMVARHIGKYLPGNPAVVPKNMPGAGSILAMNYLYNVAPRDGTYLGMIDQAAPLTQLFGMKGLKADVTKFNWIGRITDNAAVLYAWHTAPVQNIRDAFSKELIISAPGQNSRMWATFLKNLLGLKLKILTGYKGAAESRLALERGEIQALTQPYPVLRAEKPEWIRDGKITLLLHVGIDPYPALSGVPMVTDLARNADERKMIEFMASSARIGRSVMSPPGEPAERVRLLRAAFMKVMRDADFLAEIRKARLDLNPMPGDGLQAVIERTVDQPPALVARAKQLAGVGAGRRSGKKKE